MILIVISVVFLWVLPYSLPYEDAAILYRYAENWGQGHGFAWNVGEKNVDGATDFLFTLILGQLNAWGVEIENGARWLAFFSVLGSTAWIWRLILRHGKLGWAIAGTLWFLTGPIWLYVQAGFATPFAILVFLLAFSATLRHHRSDPAMGRYWGIHYFLCGLARPELGLISPMLAGLWGKFRRITMLWLVLTLLVLGSAYLLVRYVAFNGEILPAPFYVKSGGIHFGQGIAYFLSGISAWALFPMIPVLGGLFFAEYRKESMRMLALLAIWAGLWLVISQETNFYHRYQYPVFSMLIVVGMIQAGRMVPKTGWIKWISVILFGLVLGWQVRNLTWDYPYAVTPQDGRATLGKLLATYQDRGYTLLATECGLLPYYSHWNTLDALGLNSYHIAQNGLDWQYLQDYNPTLIMYHEDPGQTSTHVSQLLQKYAISQNYQHAAAFCAAPNDCDHYWVKAGLPHSEELSNVIAQTPYFRQWSRSYIPNSLLPEKSN